MKRLLFTVFMLAALLAGAPAYAQTTLNSTTLSTALNAPPFISTQPTNQVTVASLGSGSTAIAVGNVLYMDQEAMIVTALPTTGTTLTVKRNQLQTLARGHAVGAIIYYGNPQAFVIGRAGIQFNSGTCTATSELYLPRIDVLNGTIGDCQDSVWRWFRLSTWTSLTMVRHPVADAAYTATLTDYIIAYTSLTAARAVTLPSPTGLTGKTLIIKDETGNAGTSSHNITIVGTVDGVTNPTAINAGYGVYRVYSNGTAWWSW